MTRLFICSILITGLPILVSGAIITVPGEYTTIQAGMDAAEAGDTVLVSDGTYMGAGNKNLDFNGKSIKVVSENGAELCIIDCESDGRGFDFHTGETGEAMLQGFTIRNGNIDESGAGIRCINAASPTILECIISANTVGFGDGGGIYAEASSMTVSNCIVTGNNGGFYGGGICCMDEGTAQARIIGCTVSGNTAYESGGIHADSTFLLVADCLISGNTADYGGGIECDGNTVTVQNCLITNNSANTGAGMISKDSAVISECTVFGNAAVEYGGGLEVVINAATTVSNCIFWNNTAPLASEIWIGLAGWPSTLTVTYSTVQGGESQIYVDPGSTLIWGNGAIDMDPLFVSGPTGDFYLSHTTAGQPSDSPCIDAGSGPSSGICFSSYSGDVCMSDLTSTTDQSPDIGIVNMGYHYHTDTPSCVNHGDVNFDGELTAGDAQLAFLIVLELFSPTFEERCAADCNGDDEVTAGDAQSIFGAVLNLDECVDPV